MKTLSVHQVRAAFVLATVGGLLALVYFVNPHLFSSPRAQAGLTQNVSGWTWSENIGWTSFNSLDCDSDKNGRVDAGICGGDNTSTIARDYGVSVNTSTKATGGTGALSGTAWNEYVGWVSFDRATTGNPPTAPFNGGAGSIAQIDWTTGSTTGWMRVLSAMDTPAFGAPTWKAPVLTAGAILTPQSDSSQAVDYSGNYLYLGGDNALAIMDISSPVGTTQVGTFNINIFSGSETTDVRYHPIGGIPLVFVTTYYGGLVIVDVTSPTSPILKGGVNLSGEVWAVDFSADDKYAFVVGSNGIYVVDIQNPASPTLQTTLDFPGTMGNGAVVVGAYMYVAARDGGVQVINIANPLAPAIVGSYTTGFNGTEWAYNVHYAAPYLYVARHTTSSTQSNSSVLVLDISTPTSPSLVTSVEVPLAAPQPEISSSLDRGPRSVLVSGNLMFVPSDRAGLYIYDISNILNPQTLGHFSVPYSSKGWEVVVKNNVAYLAGGTNDLFVIEPSVGPWWDGWISLSGNALDTAPSTKGSYSVKITTDKFSGWAWGSNVVGWMDFSPKIGGISVGPVVGAPPCTISDVPDGAWGACQRIGSCPADAGSTIGIKVGTCTTGGTVTSACTLPALVCAAGPTGPAPILGCNYNGVCNVGETPITCPKDCKVRYLQF